MKSKRELEKKGANRKTGRRILFLLLIISVSLGICFYFDMDSKIRKTTYTKPYESPFKKEGKLFFIKAESNDTIKKIDIEVASDDYERTQGLMFRRSMADSLGMLFIFDEEEPQSFWMRNTYISLDIIYVNKKSVIVNMQKYTQPLTEWGYPSRHPAIYVLETNAGFCDKHNLKEGDKIFYITDLMKPFN